MSLNLNALETSFDLIAPRGDELMDEYEAAWNEAFAIVAGAMIEGAERGVTAAAA